MQDAWAAYGKTLGYDSIEEIIRTSSHFTGRRQISADSLIYSITATDLTEISPILVSDLPKLGISFDSQHVVSGKKIDEDQTARLIQFASEKQKPDLTDYTAPAAPSYWIFYNRDEKTCIDRIAGLFYPFHSNCSKCKDLLSTWRKGDKVLFYCPNYFRAELFIDSVEKVPEDELSKEEYTEWETGGRTVYRAKFTNPILFEPPIALTSELRTELLGSPGASFQGRSLLPITKEQYERIKRGPVTTLPPSLTLEKLSEDTFLPQELLREWESLLEEKKQIILYGPPGTGKTFVAKKFAEYFAGYDGETEIVVFHPSYGYEDFVEGIRPRIVKETEQIIYEPYAGVLRQFSKAAAENQNRKYVLLIDEINRGNIARIFGEIIYCLEYRGEEGKVILPYSRQSFFIPSNVYIIGTMNSADRSIALVDYALRRRFSFVDFLPQQSILEKWFSKNPPLVAKDGVVTLLERVNQHIEEDDKLGKHFLIGHSYFMRPQLKRNTLEQIWKYNIIPLLEEYYFEDEEAIDGFRKLFTEIFPNIPTIPPTT